MDGSVSIHTRNNQSLAIKMFRDSGNLSSAIMNNIFAQKDKSRYNCRYKSRYKLRQISKFLRPLVKSVSHRSENVSLIGPKVRDMLPDDYKNADNLDTFKNKVTKWKPGNCPCRLCKIYINNIGFI